jgi:hypothetical protein
MSWVTTSTFSASLKTAITTAKCGWLGNLAARVIGFARDRHVYVIAYHHGEFER